MLRDTHVLRARRFAYAIIGLVAVVLAVAIMSPPALALGDPLGELQGGATANAVTCATSPTLIEPSAVGRPRAKSMTIKNTSATAVYIGGASVDTTAGLSVCSSGCAYTNVFEFDGAVAYCRVAAATQVVYPTWSY